MITLNLTAEQVDALLDAVKGAYATMHISFLVGNEPPSLEVIERELNDLNQRSSILHDAIAAVENQRRRKKSKGD